MDKDIISEYLTNQYSYFSKLLSEEKNKFMRHYFQGHLDFISSMCASFGIYLFDDL